jgi:protein involved in temperature-dependent protein secretion
MKATEADRQYRATRYYESSDEPQYCTCCKEVRWSTGPDPTLSRGVNRYCICDEDLVPLCKFCGELSDGRYSGWVISINGDECPKCRTEAHIF